MAYHQILPLSEEKAYLKGGCFSLIALIILGGAFVGSVYLLAWIF